MIAQHLRFLLVGSDALQIYTVAGRKPTAIHILTGEGRWGGDGAGTVNPQNPQKKAECRVVSLSFPALGEQRQEVPRLTQQSDQSALVVMHSHTQALTCMQSHAHTQTWTHTHTQRRALTHMHSHACTYVYTLICVHSRAHASTKVIILDRRRTLIFHL